MEEGAEEGEKGEKKTEDEKTEETNGTDAAANGDKEEEVGQEEEKKENGEEEKKENGEEEEKSTPERNATPAPIIEKAEEVRQVSEVDDCKAPIIDNSSSESEEEEGGAVKVSLNRCPSCHPKLNTNIYWIKV